MRVALGLLQAFRGYVEAFQRVLPVCDELLVRRLVLVFARGQRGLLIRHVVLGRVGQDFLAAVAVAIRHLLVQARDPRVDAPGFLAVVVQFTDAVYPIAQRFHALIELGLVDLIHRFAVAVDFFSREAGLFAVVAQGKVVEQVVGVEVRAHLAGRLIGSGGVVVMAAPDQPIHPNDIFPGPVAPGFGHGFKGFHRPLDRVAVRGMDGFLFCRIGRQCKRHADIQRRADCQVKTDAMPAGKIRDHLAVFVAQRGLAGLIKADFDLAAIPGSVA